MKNELKEKFKGIADKDGANFSRRIKMITQSEDSGELADSLKNFILMIPDFITQIRIWMNDPQIPARYKELHGFFMTYLFHEEDFLPDADGGLFGYLDDAYMIGSVYFMTMRGAGFDSQASAIDSNSAKSAVPRWLEDTRKVIPGETEKIDKMLLDILQGNLESFQHLMNGKRHSASGELGSF